MFTIHPNEIACVHGNKWLCVDCGKGLETVALDNMMREAVQGYSVPQVLDSLAGALAAERDLNLQSWYRDSSRESVMDAVRLDQAFLKIQQLRKEITK